MRRGGHHRAIQIVYVEVSGEPTSGVGRSCGVSRAFRLTCVILNKPICVNRIRLAKVLAFHVTGQQGQTHVGGSARKDARGIVDGVRRVE
jgi:hypothetical protein